MFESWNLQKSALHSTNIAAFLQILAAMEVAHLSMIYSTNQQCWNFHSYVQRAKGIYQLEQFVYLWDPLHELIPTDTYQQLSNEKVFLT